MHLFASFRKTISIEKVTFSGGEEAPFPPEVWGAVLLAELPLPPKGRGTSPESIVSVTMEGSRMEHLQILGHNYTVLFKKSSVWSILVLRFFIFFLDIIIHLSYSQPSPVHQPNTPCRILWWNWKAGGLLKVR